MTKSSMQAISGALQRLEQKAQKYIDNYSKTGKKHKDIQPQEEWRLFKEGFLHLNYHYKPNDLIEFKTCDLGDPETHYVLSE